jgi:hypothetical protein
MAMVTQIPVARKRLPHPSARGAITALLLPGCHPTLPVDPEAPA